jgi:hypothetical protein
MEFFEDQRRRMNDDPNRKWASLLLQMTRDNKLQHFREFGLYSDAKYQVSDEAIDQVIQMADAVHKILLESRDTIREHAVQIPGLNCEREALPVPAFQVGNGDYDMLRPICGSD